ncbi:MAG: YigZ family protein [Clostridium sp.]|uniref:YigZ family protein n=1 Tax=Clostridium sp. TaxID=1506 RepID=UPI0039EB286E
MSYYTIKDETSFQFEEKKSIFISNIKRVYSEEEAKEFIQNIKTQYKDARHNVYAYVIGEKTEVQRYSDDGEPQGTAGIPMLEVIKKSGITDVVIVVTRYFGGILLGTGGLARAYSKGASSAIKEGKIVLKVKGKALNITVNYDLLGKLQYLCEKKMWHIESLEYTDKVKLMIYFEIDTLEEAKKTFIETTSGNCQFLEGEDTYYFKIENRLFLE